jgi:protease-4
MFFTRKKDNTPKSAEQQLADIAGELIKQNKAASRRRLLIVLAVLIYFGVMASVGLNQSGLLDELIKQEEPFVAEVILSGTIAQGAEIDSDDATELLEEAFSHENSKAVILRLNSGGGSPVQSSKIYDNIKRLKEIHKKKLYVVIEDVCASGCYYIASSADEIYANKSSIVGSIGVIMPSFGLNKAIEKIGVERRVYTAGENKALLDIFSPENKKDVEHIQEKVLTVAHNNFISDVKTGRGDRLKDNKDIFSGLIWLAGDAQKLGLIDGLGDAYFVANKIIKINNRVKFEKAKTLIEELTQASMGFILNNTHFKLQ